MVHKTHGELPVMLMNIANLHCVILTSGLELVFDKSKLGICQRAMKRSKLGVKLIDKLSKMVHVARKQVKLKWDWADHVCHMQSELWLRPSWSRSLYKSNWSFLKDWSDTAQNQYQRKKRGRHLSSNWTQKDYNTNTLLLNKYLVNQNKKKS